MGAVTVASSGPAAAFAVTSTELVVSQHHQHSYHGHRQVAPHTLTATDCIFPQPSLKQRNTIPHIQTDPSASARAWAG